MTFRFPYILQHGSEARAHVENPRNFLPGIASICVRAGAGKMKSAFLVMSVAPESHLSPL